MTATADYIVLDHNLDEAAGVYRIVVGLPVTAQAPDPEHDGDDPAPLVDVVLGYEDVHDYVFAADDDRWHAGGKRRRPEHVAAEQRDEIAGALRGRARRGPKDTPDPVALPGVGDAITA